MGSSNNRRGHSILVTVFVSTHGRNEEEICSLTGLLFLFVLSSYCLFVCLVVCLVVPQTVRFGKQ